MYANISIMMSSISWKEFSIYISIALFCYYVFIVITYYQNDILRLNRRFFKLTKSYSDSNETGIDTQPSGQSVDETVSGESYTPDAEADEHNLLNDLLEKLKQQIDNAASRNLIKEELLVSIQSVLVKYLNLQYSSFLSSIESFIQSSVENECSIYLTDQEVSALWKK